MYVTQKPKIERLFVADQPKDKEKYEIIDKKLLKNDISMDELKTLRKNINAEDLSYIIQHIYDLNETYILKLSAVEGMLRKLDDIKNAKRNKRFQKRIRQHFRNGDKTRKVILAEGDSWFNYPVILTDIIDRISMEKNFNVYSLASGGDWLLNMLTARHYVEELSVLHPDVFLISGGGNDLVGSRRLAAMVTPEPCQEFEKNPWAEQLIKNAQKIEVPLDKEMFERGLPHLSRDFFALMMFFHLQYYFLIHGILGDNDRPSKFPGIKIITQGYDFAIPSFDKKFGFNPLKWYVPFIRKFLGHGVWLKEPLETRGIVDPLVQRSIVYAMIYLFNEMMIEMNVYFNTADELKVMHIDSRGSIGEDGWTDELHPLPQHFMNTGNVFVDCLNGIVAPTYQNVFVVKKIIKS